MTVIYAIEGNGSRPSHKGDGWLRSNVMYTLNTIEHHAVCVCVRWMMLVIQRRFKNVTISDTDISPTLESAMGNEGGEHTDTVLQDMFLLQ